MYLRTFHEISGLGRLIFKECLALGILTIAMGSMLFIPAGTVQYWQAWVYLAVFTGASILQALHLMRKDPALLERRLRGGPLAEKDKSQKIIMVFVSTGFVALLVIPALDYRYGWSRVSLSLIILGNILIGVGFFVIFLVYRENSYASATIEVAVNQKVISTGPYAIVRHPMYAGGLLYLIGTPLALASYWGLLVVAATTPFLIWRLLEEEGFLDKNLPGYPMYCEKVRWRLLPGVF